MKSWKIVLLIGLIFSWNATAGTNQMISGIELLSGKPLSVEPGTHKALVVVFLSALCPCSNSHVEELKSLAQEFPDFSFVGVHSNTNEGKEISVSYFQNAKLPFPILQDFDAKIANEYKAFKTPHAFVIKTNGEIAYRGGVSSSRNFAEADKKYLRDALTDIQNNRPIRVAEGRTLGCVIARGGHNAW